MTKSQKKLAVCVAHVQPSPRDSGGKIGFYGNVAALQAYGYDVHCAVFSEPKPLDQTEIPVSFVGPLNHDGNERNPDFDALLAELQPNVVWLHEARVWAPFAPHRDLFPHVLLCGDPEWQIRQERRRFHEHTRNPVRRLIKGYRWSQELASLKEDEKRVAAAASERGVLAAWSPADAPGIRARTGLDTAVCSLVFPDWGMRPSSDRQHPPELLLLGGFNGVHTRDGLRYFFDEVWPVWQRQVDRPEAVIRVIGAGKLPDHFACPAENEFFQWIGFAPDHTIPRMDAHAQKLARQHYGHLMLRRQTDLSDIAPMEIKKYHEAQSEVHNNISIAANSLADLGNATSIQRLRHWLAHSTDEDILEPF